MFTWRIKHESLALRTNLAQRGVKLESTKCLLCGLAAEDGAHLFVKCKEVKEAWRAMNCERIRKELEEFTSVHAMQDYLWTSDESVAAPR